MIATYFITSPPIATLLIVFALGFHSRTFFGGGYRSGPAADAAAKTPCVESMVLQQKGRGHAPGVVRAVSDVVFGLVELTVFLTKDLHGDVDGPFDVLFLELLRDAGVDDHVLFEIGVSGDVFGENIIQERGLAGPA